MKRKSSLILLSTLLSMGALVSCGAPVEEKSNFTITWKNWDGTILEVDENVKIDSMPSYDGETPTKPDEGLTVFTFEKWSPSSKIRVSKDVEFVAQFSSITYELLGEGKTEIKDGEFEKLSLEYVKVADSVTKIGDYAFSNCTSMLDIKLPNGLEHIGENAFDHCYRLDIVSIPDSVTYLGDYCFNCCSGLRTVKLPKNIASIPYYCFYECSGLKSVTFPENLKRIKEGAFYSTSFNMETLPDTLEIIEQYAFSRCNSMVKITLPNSLTTIFPGAFQYSSSLCDVYIPLSVKTIYSNAFNNINSGVVIRCESNMKPERWMTDWCNASAKVMWGCSL